MAARISDTFVSIVTIHSSTIKMVISNMVKGIPELGLASQIVNWKYWRKTSWKPASIPQQKWVCLAILEQDKSTAVWFHTWRTKRIFLTRKPNIQENTKQRYLACFKSATNGRMGSNTKRVITQSTVYCKILSVHWIMTSRSWSKTSVWSESLASTFCGNYPTAWG